MRLTTLLTAALLTAVPVAVTALGWMWLGYALFAETREPSAEPASVVR